MKIARPTWAGGSSVGRIAVLLGMLAWALAGRAADSLSVPGLSSFGDKAHTQADLISEAAAIAPSQPFTVALRLKMDPGWHTYWSNAGDAGLPTTIDWHLPPGWQTGPIQWPTPEKLPDGKFVDYIYEGTVLLLVEITPPATIKPGDTAQLSATVNWLECAEVCVQQKTDLSLSLPVAAAAQVAAANQPVFAQARAALPQPSTQLAFSAWRQGGKLFLGMEPLPNALPKPEELPSAYFFSADSQTKTSAPQTLHRTSKGWVLELDRSDFAPADAKTLPGVLIIGNATTPGVAANPALGAMPPADFADFTTSTSSAAPANGLLALLLLGFLGGLILNIMPCVFPVLGIKALGLAQQAGAARGAVARHGLVFTAGVLLSMWALVGVLLSLRAAGANLGWGFQLQSPTFVIGLAIFFLLFGLSLSGVFEIGGSLIGAGADLTGKSGAVGSFFQGCLAVVVATPCTAPLLAPALGAALTLPAGEALVVFTAIALGLSSPYLVLSLFPGLARLLPRPGAWMETFRQLLAFPLYATVAFLLYTLAGQVSPERFLNILLGLVLAGLAAWFYGRYATVAATPQRRTVGRVGALLLLAAGAALAYWPIQELDWEPWSSARVAELQKEGRPIYVDFTARWCLTCQVNKDAVFHSTDRVLTEFNHANVAMLRADLTANDPLIVAELARFGRASVPLDLLYLPGHADPVILPSVLTPGIVLDALAGKSAPAP